MKFVQSCALASMAAYANAADISVVLTIFDTTMPNNQLF